MVDSYGDDFALIRYHVSWPSPSDPYYQFNAAENMGRNYYYGNSFTPHFFLKGDIDCGSNSGSWSGQINNQLNNPAPLDIQIYGEHDSTTRNVHLEIYITATSPITHTNLKLRTSIIESELYYPGPNGISMHHQTFRDMIPNTSGTYFTITEGEQLMFEQSFSYSSILTPENCEIILFVQSDTNKEILQGAKEGVTTLPDEPYGLEHFSLIAPANNDTINHCYPEFVWHASDDPDSGFAISYEVEIDTDSLFDDPILSGLLPDTVWNTPLCLYDNQYYWRVRATNNSAPDLYSPSIFSFEVKQYGRIRGTVYDEQSNPLDNVFVELIGTPKYDSTDGTGQFVIDSVFAGDYSLFFYCAGYEDTVVSDIQLIPADTAVVDVILIEGPGCYYITGDVNDTGSANGLDVTYLVAYLKGGAEPPYICDCGTYGPTYSAADVNGSCTVNGLDVTYMVNYFKGIGELQNCIECPPVP